MSDPGLDNGLAAEGPATLTAVEEALNQVLRDKGAPPAQLSADTVLLGDALPIDSLDLATLVVALEQHFGFDPFRDGFRSFRTAGELAALYDRR